MSAKYETKHEELMLAVVPMAGGGFASGAAPGTFKQHEYKDGLCICCQRGESYSHLPCENPPTAAADYEHVYEILP